MNLSIPTRDTINSGLPEGHYPGLSEERYHDDPALSSTLIRDGLSEGLLDFAHTWHSDGPDSEAIDLGSLIHMAVLEPDRWEHEVVDRPEPPVDVDDMSGTDTSVAEAIAAPADVDIAALADDCGVQTSTIEKRLENEGIQTLAEFIAEHGTPPDPSLVERAKPIRDAILEHPRIRGGLLREGRAEESVVWRDERDISFRARPDYLQRIGSSFLMADLKTTSKDLGYWKRRSFWQRRYHQQAAHYADGVEAVLNTAVSHCLVVVASTSEPYKVEVLELEQEALETGRKANRSAIHKLVEHWNNPDRYPGTPHIQTLETPNWIQRSNP